MTVVDTSAFAKVLIREEGWERVLPFLDPSSDPRSPDLMAVEAANVIWKYCLRGGLSPEAALRLHGEMAKALDGGPVELVPSLPLLGRALEISLEHGISVYDSLFLALAEELGHSLVTCDGRQAEVGGRLGLRVTLV